MRVGGSPANGMADLDDAGEGSKEVDGPEDDDYSYWVHWAQGDPPHDKQTLNVKRSFI